MKITILTENTAGNKLIAEQGISYLIELQNYKILFDTGPSDVFLKNAEKLNIDLKNDIDFIVLSHGHWDHGDGLQFLENKTLIAHPSAFIKRFGKIDHFPVGLKLTRKEIQQKFDLIESKTAYKIVDNVIFLGEIPRKNEFEAQSTPFEDEFGNDDFMLDDSALALVVKNQLVVVTGCSHSGICNIIEYAKEVSGISKIKAVVGGLHLKNRNKQAFETIECFKNNDVEYVYPGHCTELPVLSLFYKNFHNTQLKTGMVLEFE